MAANFDRRTGRRQLVDFAKIWDTLSKNKLLWVAPTVAFTIIGTLHALTKYDEWKASQALVVRDEAIGELGFGRGAPMGRFDSNDLLKRALETILQIAKNHRVAEITLRQVGPEKPLRREFPQEEDIEKLLERISVTAAKGTEFGTSEVVYLSVKAKTPERAIDLTDAVCTQLETRMQQLRNEHAQSIIAELSEKQNLAERELQTVTVELSRMEQQLGEDLGEMRTLAEAGSAGESNLRTQLNQIKVELRQVESASQTQVELLSVLRRINDDPDAILATPNQLLQSQVALSRLKDGFVDAQLRTARLRGGLTEQHPRVRAAALSEQNVKQQLLVEAKNAIKATQAEIEVNNNLSNSLRVKLQDVQSRLDRLAAQRASYVNLISKVSQRREQLRLASVALAEAHGRQEAARASSLITRLDSPVTGSRPVGLGRVAIVACSLFGGLILGLSLVYLLAPWQEIQRAGRRKSDHRGRRSNDPVEPADDRRSPRPHRPSRLIDVRPMQFQELPQTVAALAGVSSDRDKGNSLDHLTSLVNS